MRTLPCRHVPLHPPTATILLAMGARQPEPPPLTSLRHLVDTADDSLMQLLDVRSTHGSYALETGRTREVNFLFRSADATPQFPGRLPQPCRKTDSIAGDLSLPPACAVPCPHVCHQAASATATKRRQDGPCDQDNRRSLIFREWLLEQARAAPDASPPVSPGRDDHSQPLGHLLMKDDSVCGRPLRTVELWDSGAQCCYTGYRSGWRSPAAAITAGRPPAAVANASCLAVVSPILAQHSRPTSLGSSPSTSPDMFHSAHSNFEGSLLRQGLGGGVPWASIDTAPPSSADTVPSADATGGSIICSIRPSAAQAWYLHHTFRAHLPLYNAPGTGCDAAYQSCHGTGR